MKKVIDTEKIKEFIFENKLTKKKFCEMCKISVSTLNKILNDQTNVGIIAIFKICRVMKINIVDLFLD